MWHTTAASVQQRVCDGGQRRVPRGCRHGLPSARELGRGGLVMVFSSNFHISITLQERLQGWRVDAEGLGDEWGWGTGCKMPKDSVEKCF